MNKHIQRILSKQLTKEKKATDKNLTCSEYSKESKLKTARFKIAKLNTHTKLLSAKLSSIKIGKLLEAKKKR